MHEGKFDYSQGEASRTWNVAVFPYRVVRAMRLLKDYEINPESLDSLFRKVEEQGFSIPPKP